jgi:hypothetical protein
MRLKKFNDFLEIDDQEIENIFDNARAYIIENNKVENPYHNNEHMVNVFNNAMLLFDQYKEEYELTPSDKLCLGLAALFHDFNHSGGKLTDKENIELALVALKEFLDAVNKSDIWNNRKLVNPLIFSKIEQIIIATEFPHLDIDLDILQKIIRDADTMGGITEGWKSVVTSLAKEYNKTLEEFIPTQIKFLDTVKFNTDYCNQLLKDNKEEIVSGLNKMKS